YGLYKLFKGYRQSSGSKKRQLLYIFWASLIYLLGEELVIPTLFNFPFLDAYPWWNYTSIIFASVIAYAIIKQRLMDISIIISRAVAESLAVLFHALIYLSLAGFYRTYLSPKIDLAFIIITILYGILVAQTHQRLRNYIQTSADKLFLKGKYDYYSALSEIGFEMTKSISLKNLLNTLHRTFFDIIEINHPQVFLRETSINKEGEENRFVAWDLKRHSLLPETPPLLKDSPLLRYAKNNENIVLLDDLNSNLQDRRIYQEEKERLKEVWAQMRDFKAELCIIATSQEKIIAVFLLGKKLSEDPYSDKDLRLLRNLANQAAIALENARLFNDLQRTLQELKGAQEGLIQAGKMAALGTMTAGIAHEINQPLSGIKGYTEIMLRKAKEDTQQYKDLAVIMIQVERMIKLLHHLRTFSRQASFKLERLNIAEPIEEALAFFREQLRAHNINIKLELPPNLPQIMGDANQIQQLCINLITNARDAIDALAGDPGGEIHILGEKVRLADQWGQLTEFLQLTFSNNGRGIPKENLIKIFDPFFTTKEVGKGMGLGLSICYAIIQNHNGRIEVESKPGQKTSFRVFLPILKTK
ncbi:MAG: ATP-binding protein, partial [Candidatus Margulisiibacteriota bacterium]